MGVYVDPMRPCLMNPNWRWPESCHLVADSIEELHAFAKKLRMSRSWFQTKGLPHYDLVRHRRALAVKLGAVEITGRQLVERLRRYREGHDPLGFMRHA